MTDLFGYFATAKPGCIKFIETFIDFLNPTILSLTLSIHSSSAVLVTNHPHEQPGGS